MVRRMIGAAVVAFACTDPTGPLSIEPGSFILSVGTRQPLQVLAGGRPLGPGRAATASWTSSDTTVVLVLGSGDAFGMRSGTAKVTASFPDGSATADVLVIPTPAGIWLAIAGDSFYVFQLNEVRPAGSSTGTVSGSMTMQVGSQNDMIYYFTVDGTHTTPTVSLRLARPGSPDATFSGAFENDTNIVGQRAGQGPSARDFTLTRPTCYCPVFVSGVKGGPSAAPVACTPQLCAPAPGRR